MATANNPKASITKLVKEDIILNCESGFKDKERMKNLSSILIDNIKIIGNQHADEISLIYSQDYWLELKEEVIEIPDDEDIRKYFISMKSLNSLVIFILYKLMNRV